MSLSHEHGLPGHFGVLGNILFTIFFVCMMGVATCGNCLGIEYWQDEPTVETPAQVETRLYKQCRKEADTGACYVRVGLRKE